MRGTHEHPVVELDGCRVLQDVPPPGVGLVAPPSVGRVHELVLRRNVAFSHVRPLVIDESSVESGNEGAWERKQGMVSSTPK